MKTIRFMSKILLLAVILMTDGCMSTRSVQKWPESAPVSGAAAMQGKTTRKNSPYYPHHDFFKGGITPTLKLIKEFRTCQQTTEYTCGAASLRMVLDHWGMADKTERALAEEMDIRPEDNPKNGAYGCSTAAIESALERRGVKILPRQKFETAEAFAGFVKNQLAAKCPILVEWSTWGGHWTVIIGYDDMGTAEAADDVLIMADPYDTTDHCQDGYVIVPFERFFHEWFDAGVLSRGITRQQYVAPIKPCGRKAVKIHMHFISRRCSRRTSVFLRREQSMKSNELSKLCKIKTERFLLTYQKIVCSTEAER